MPFWSQWVDSLARVFEWLATDVGVGVGLSVIALTLLLRTLVLPITWSNAYRGSVRQRKLARLQPELARLKDRYVKEPEKYTRAMLDLYERNGVALFDGRSVIGALVQTPLLLGVYAALRQSLTQGRFLWVANLAKPDLWLAILAGLTTALLMAAAPDMPEHIRMVMLIVPAALMVITALHFSSGIALYWATSNLYSAAQTFAVRSVIARRVKAGALVL